MLNIIGNIMKAGGEIASEIWILATNFWNDIGTWADTDTWND